MRVFNINKAVGYASSGVEYAQVYRRRLFAKIDAVEDYYVFTDYISTNLCVFTDLLDFPRDRIIWIYNELSRRPTRPCTIIPEAYIKRVANDYERVDGNGFIDLYLRALPMRLRLWLTRDGYLDRVDTTVEGALEMVEHFDESLNNIEYYQGGMIVRRVFFDLCGCITLEQSYRQGEIDQTIFRGEIISGRSRFFQLFFKQLWDRDSDVVIIDRTLDVIDGIYPVIGNHRLFSVVHAEHYDLKKAEDGVLLWNNHYEYVFGQAFRYAGMIVSTDRQKHYLEQQLQAQAKQRQSRLQQKQNGIGKSSLCNSHRNMANIKQGETYVPPVEVIPVGCIPSLTHKDDFKRYALITASRLASEKHLDLLIKAVVKAREVLPEISLDIYGEGNRGPLMQMIAQSNSSDYVSLMGHHQLSSVYASYALYVSASTSEGFGLSLMEAISEGLPIIGFDVEYGNREMVEDGVNGRLLPFMQEELDVDNLSAAMVQLLSDEDVLHAMRKASLKKAQRYLEESVRKDWERVLQC